jgi:hypothetical protein
VAVLHASHLKTRVKPFGGVGKLHVDAGKQRFAVHEENGETVRLA